MFASADGVDDGIIIDDVGEGIDVELLLIWPITVDEHSPRTDKRRLPFCILAYVRMLNGENLDGLNDGFCPEEKTSPRGHGFLYMSFNTANSRPAESSGQCTDSKSPCFH
jgi:hypothetical protein